MKKILFSLFLIASALSCFSQTKTDTITIKKSAFYYNGKLLTPKKLVEITKPNPIAFEKMQQAQKNYIPALILSSAGGFAIGYPLGGLIGGNKMNWTLFGIGAGLVAISIPFSTAYNKHAKDAVNIYNQGIQKTSFRKVKLEGNLSNNGIGLKLSF
jgi:hypothetical protein